MGTLLEPKNDPWGKKSDKTSEKMYNKGNTSDGGGGGMVTLETRVAVLENKFDTIDKKLDKIDNRLDKIDDRLHSLYKWMFGSFIPLYLSILGLIITLLLKK